jgi:hypothetical protein
VTGKVAKTAVATHAVLKAGVAATAAFKSGAAIKSAGALLAGEWQETMLRVSRREEYLAAVQLALKFLQGL